MGTFELYRRYQELQRYVGWSDEDAARIASVAALLEPLLPELVEGFYAEIEQHAGARSVITGGAEQIARLKQTLIQWLKELLTGPYDIDYVARRWRVGYRHVEIGLEQIYTNVALSRLRSGLHLGLHERIHAGEIDGQAYPAISLSLNKLLDLDLAIIEDAYQTEYHRRQQQIEKLAAIGQVAGGVAHELRNPLNVIKTSVFYLLNAKQLSEEKTAEHLKRIERQVGLADSVITALSNFAKLPVPALQSVAVGDWLREVVGTVNVPEHVDVAIDSPTRLSPAWIDPNQMSIVVSNLVRNAIDAMPQGGKLTITSRDEDEEILIDVADTGVGITVDDVERIMEPLFTTKARGIGLGLPMAKAIVEKNNGSLSVTSEPGQGATFTMRLPSAPRADQSLPLHT